jgi:hypothetical protein
LSLSSYHFWFFLGKQGERRATQKKRKTQAFTFFLLLMGRLGWAVYGYVGSENLWGNKKKYVTSSICDILEKRNAMGRP